MQTVERTKLEDLKPKYWEGFNTEGLTYSGCYEYIEVKEDRCLGAVCEPSRSGTQQAKKILIIETENPYDPSLIESIKEEIHDDIIPGHQSLKRYLRDFHSSSSR